MNIQDRRRVANLIEEHYSSLIRVASTDPTKEEIQKEVESIVTVHKLKPTIDKVVKLEEQLHQLKKGLSDTLKSIYTSKRKRRDDCECVEDHDEMLREMAYTRLSESKDKANRVARLYNERRQILAKVEVAKSSEDISKLLKSCGLL